MLDGAHGAASSSGRMGQMYGRVVGEGFSLEVSPLVLDRIGLWGVWGHSRCVERGGTHWAISSLRCAWRRCQINTMGKRSWHCR